VLVVAASVRRRNVADVRPPPRVHRPTLDVDGRRRRVPELGSDDPGRCSGVPTGLPGAVVRRGAGGEDTGTADAR